MKKYLDKKPELVVLLYVGIVLAVLTSPFWLLIGGMNANAIRVYTLHPRSFIL